MTFSIIVPVYNIELYIEECIESLLCQKDVEFEILLIDDGSRDQSGRICDDFANIYKNVKVIHKTNGGLSDARNVGIKEAKGQYILFVDGDDLIAKNSLQSIKKKIEDNNFPDLVCLELKKFFSNNMKVISMGDGITSSINNLREEELFFYLANLPKYPASACTKAIKRELFLNKDLMFEKGILSEDLEWCIRLFLNVETICYCSVDYYYYRQAREGSISNTSSVKKTIDVLNTYIKWTSYAKELQNIGKKQMISSYMEYVFRFLIMGYSNINKDERKMYRKRVKEGSWVLGTRKDNLNFLNFFPLNY